jgi:hypothetical protein
MPAVKFDHVVDFEVIYCANCNVPFGMTGDYISRRRKDGDGFHCPNGHANVFRDSEADKLRKQLDNARLRMEWAEQDAKRARESLEVAQRSKAAYKGQLTKLKNRVSKGVCPCCNRTFANLAKHMGTKHPDYHIALEN